jgi:hypothetical protein
MPHFSPEPAVQLAGDLQALFAMRNLENERAVQQLFKQAEASADAAVERELRQSSDKLLSKARLQQLRKEAERKCWLAFEEPLSLHTWTKSTPHFRASRALVQAEACDARLMALTLTNEQRLKAYFGEALTRALTAYNANRSLLSMPAPEAEVEAQHGHIAAWTRELLHAGGTNAEVHEAAAAGLTDTDAFAETLASLEAALKEGRQQSLDKNVDLWKAHSDEATRCAVAANRVTWKACGFLCIYNKVPWVHRATSRRHLNDCFARSAIGSTMSPQLRAHVFEAWYSRDLSREVQQVQFKFNAFATAVLALVLGATWQCYCGRPRHDWPSFWQPEPSFRQQLRQQAGFCQGHMGQPLGSFGPPYQAGCYAPDGCPQPPMRSRWTFRGGA